LQSGLTSLDTYQMYESLEHTEGKKSQHRRHSDLDHRHSLCYVVFSFLVSSCSSKPDVSHVVMLTSHFNQLFTHNKEHEHCNRYPVPAHICSRNLARAFQAGIDFETENYLVRGKVPRSFIVRGRIFEVESCVSSTSLRHPRLSALGEMFG